MPLVLRSTRLGAAARMNIALRASLGEFFFGCYARCHLCPTSYVTRSLFDLEAQCMKLFRYMYPVIVSSIKGQRALFLYLVIVIAPEYDGIYGLVSFLLS
jgi:hypothetical protein